MAKKQAKATDEIYTPPWVFEKLGLEFDLDVCSPVMGLPYLPAKNWYHAGDDGLEKKWFGRVWCNPPYSQAGLWVKKFVEHRNGVMLAPLAKSQWFIDLWQSDVKIVPLSSKFKFLNVMGEEHSIFTPVALYAFTPENVLAINNFGKVR